METKICTKCNTEYPATLYYWHKQKRGKNGLHSYCIPCRKALRKDYGSTDEFKKINRERTKEWRKNNTEKAKKASKKNRLLHGFKHDEKRREKYNNNPEYKKKIIDKRLEYKENLHSSYIASSLRVGVKSIPDDVLETRRLIISLKRAIKDNY